MGLEGKLERRSGAVARAWRMALAAVCLVALAPVAEARQDPASIVIDANSGRTLQSDAPDEPRYPASLTKMMTLYIVYEELAAERLSTTDRITFSANAAARPPSKIGLKPGQSLTVDHAIRALITKSANDVATAVAEHISGTEADFAVRMTRTARRLGMRQTTFRNASGLPDSAQVTTARDMATLAMALRDRFPRRFALFALRSFEYNGRTYRNHNRLLGRVAGIDGIKTGYTRASGFNIATSLRRGGKYLVGVVMGQPTGRRRNTVMRRLLAAALPKASRVRRRPPNRGTDPLLVARPRLVTRPSVVERPSLVPAWVTATRAAATSDPARATDARAPSTLDAQHVRLRNSFAASLQDRSPPPSTGRQRPPSATGAAHTYHIQVGAFFDESDARRALDGALSRAGSLLAGSQALTLRVPGKPRTIYRARFAGFDQREAAATCEKLKRVSVDCFVASAR